MVRLSVMHVANNHVGISAPLGIGLFVMVSVIVALCANHARRASRKERSKDDIGTTNHTSDSGGEDNYQEKFPPRSPLRSPKQLITTISNKAMTSLLINHKTGSDQNGGGGGGGRVVEEGFGQGGLWQKEILMGVKCQPPEFSGVIYYNCDGHQVTEFPPRSPRSPRVAHSPDFTFPMIRSSV
ncbi:hypothetical protein L2E82_13904 [Cichorium intybus]|uniref:Uncharacterized protein n=1 Tax=Cichorium intybus TaxID=13427 RepID=A0ACB9EYU9_CICIN|nr:hypothetical protein L1887_33545 [Cichorium endivia]KAI3763906.1 hypothetical protein L2E82_13904 [Cichorium intybus]